SSLCPTCFDRAPDLLVAPARQLAECARQTKRLYVLSGGDLGEHRPLLGDRLRQLVAFSRNSQCRQWHGKPQVRSAEQDRARPKPTGLCLVVTQLWSASWACTERLLCLVVERV